MSLSSLFFTELFKLYGKKLTTIISSHTLDSFTSLILHESLKFLEPTENLCLTFQEIYPSPSTIIIYKRYKIYRTGDRRNFYRTKYIKMNKIQNTRRLVRTGVELNTILLTINTVFTKIEFEITII
jgi:hypothetical protein